MWITKHTVETDATPEQVWAVWADVEGWKEWDPEIEWSKVNGPFKTGSPGETKFIKTPIMKTLLLNVEPQKTVVQEAYVSFAKVISHQLMHREGEKTKVTFKVEVKGPLALFYSLLLRRFVKKKIPAEMALMVQVIKKRMHFVSGEK